MQLKKVVFPLPLGPMTPTVSPLVIEQETPLRTLVP